MLETLPDLVAASSWAYLVVFAVAALDALFPVVPSEATAIAAGVSAGAGELDIALVVGAAGLGALVGDTSSYAVGRTAGARLVGRFFSGARAQRRLAAAERLLA